MLKALLVTLILISSVGCEAVMQNWQKARMLEHISRIQSYHGTLKETGILDSKEDLVSEITYKAPGHYSIVTKAPAKFAGTQMTYDGTTLQIYYPQTHFAIVTRNMKPITEKDYGKIVDDTFAHNTKMLSYELGRTSTVAGYPVIDINFKARHPDSAVMNGTTQVYDQYSFPLSAFIKFTGGADYSFTFTKISFNEGKELPKLEIPRDAIISEWDLNSKSYTEAELKKEAPFKFTLPQPKDMKLARIIRQTGPVPAFTAMYENHPYTVSVIMLRNYGINLVPTGRGIKMEAGTVTGELIPNPHVNTFSFIKGEAQYILVGNVPVETILAMAKEIGLP
jgi:outer membrane lipoprotein-sorting protein